jgi:hypothetical protein
MDEIRNIVGETYSDRRLTEVIIANDYDFNKALDTLLKGDTAQKPTPLTVRPTETVEKGMNYSYSSNNFY